MGNSSATTSSSFVNSDSISNSGSAIKQTKRSGLRKWLLWFLLIDFVAYSSWVLWEVGYMGIWQAGLASSGSLQILIDLVIGCLLISCWMIGDARARGVNALPWVLATIATGTIAPLAYLLVREYQLDRTEQASTSALNAA